MQRELLADRAGAESWSEVTTFAPPGLPTSPQPLQTFHQIDRAGQNGRPKVACLFEALSNRANGELGWIQPVVHFFPSQRG